MPEKIKLEDGSEREVLTQAEVEDLQGKAAKAGEAETLATTLKAAQKELDDYKGQPGAEGMKNLRESLKRAKDAAKAKGIEIDDNGNVIDTPKVPTTDDINTAAERAVAKSKVQDILASKKSRLDSDSQAVFDKKYQELTKDRDISPTNVDEYVNAALAAAGLPLTAGAPAQRHNPMDTFQGSGPIEDDATKAANTKKAVDNLKSMGYGFKNDPKTLTS